MSRFVACLCILTVFSDNGLSQDKKEPAAKEKGVEVKVFRLQLCDPSEVVIVLDELMTRLPPEAGVAGPLPMGLVPGPMGVGPMGIPMGLGAPAGVTEVIDEPEPARWTIDPRSGAIVVRGQRGDIEMAGEIMAVLEAPLDKPLPKTKRVQALILKHARPDDILSACQALDLPVQVVALNEVKMIMASGPPAMLMQWTNMVRDLDVPERRIDMNKLRRLGIGGGSPAAE